MQAPHTHSEPAPIEADIIFPNDFSLLSRWIIVEQLPSMRVAYASDDSLWVFSTRKAALLFLASRHPIMWRNP